jgi:hypothetical protein
MFHSWFEIFKKQIQNKKKPVAVGIRACWEIEQRALHIPPEGRQQ